jgi:pyruvate dehydrogenase (quinone)
MDAVEIPSSTQNYPTDPVIRPHDRDLQNLAALINESEKVTIFCGIGCANAHDEVVELAQRIHATVGYSFRGKMFVQHDNPNEIGMTGLLGLPSAYHSMHESDLVILLGTDFPYEQFMPTDCKIVQVDIKPERIGRRAKVDMGLCGKVEDTLQALLPLIRKKLMTAFYRHSLNCMLM